MKWTSQVLGADLNESKLNARGDNPDNLFEITPKLRIEIEAESEVIAGKGKGRKVFAVTAGGNEDPIGIALSEQLLILNKARDEVERTIDFNARIDVVVWRRSVLIVCLASSEINLLCPQTFQCKESKRVSPQTDLASQDQFFVDAVIHSNPDPTKIDLIAIGVDGAMYSFLNVSLVDGSSMDYTLDENMTLDIDVATIKGTMRRYLEDTTHILCATSPGRNYVVTGDKDGMLSFFKLWEDDCILENEYEQKYFVDVDIRNYMELPKDVDFKKIVRCEGLLFVLFTDGHLELLLEDELVPTGGLQLPKSSYKVQDFVMVIYSTGIVKLWAIFSNPEENEHYVGIFRGPSFSLEFTARIPVPSESAEETAMYLFPKQASPYDEPTVVLAVDEQFGWTTIYHMSESSTDSSLQILLAKSRFDKAELLAKKYGKDLDLVWTTKVKSKLSEMCSGKNEIAIEKSYRDLVSTLQNVQDAEFVCSFCTNREKGIPILEWVKELLALGLKRVGECSSSEAGRTLLLTRKKLYTFDQVLPGAGIDQWNQFNDENNSMFSQCLWFMELNEFKKCEIVWLRHCDEFIPDIDLQHFAAFFKVLFNKCLGTPDTVSLFKTIFPSAVEKCESDTELDGNQVKINAFFSLIRSQIRSLERLDKWPSEAIVFTKTLIRIIEEEIRTLEEDKLNTGEARIEKKLSICADILTKLGTLLQALVEMSNLKKDHSMRIEFDKYISESNSEVVNSMLKLLFAKDEVERFVNKFLIPYAARNHLNMDALFEAHVQSAADDVIYFINSGTIPFEERLVTLVGYIQAPKIKLACILRMTEEWPVPWMPLMKGMVAQCLHVKGDEECRNLQETIRLMETQVPYRCLLHKYRLTASKSNKGFGVYLALERILKLKKKEWWEDCIELIKHTGKFTSDSVSVIRFWFELLSPSISVDDIIPEDSQSRNDLKLKFIRRVMHKFRLGNSQSDEPPEPWQRFADCAKMLANQTSDDKTTEFLKLRQFVPILWDNSIVGSMSYPFSALELLLPSANSLSSDQIVAQCDKLAVLSFSNVNDILITIAAFLTGPGNLGSAYQKIWDLVTTIVETSNGFSGDHDTSLQLSYVQTAAIEVVHHLILFAPTTSSEYLNTLLRFCELLESSFEELGDPVAKLQTVIWIFQGLRETEIPLEREFLQIYKGIWRDNVRSVQELLSQLLAMGEVILRFGSTELLQQIFNAVSQELEHQSVNLFGNSQTIALEASSAVMTLKMKLLNEATAFELPEKNIRVQNLVKSLHVAGLPMNSYALRERNKGKLIDKLLELNLFPLAAQTALTFDFREQRSWSNILQEYLDKASVTELKTILEALKRITDLWVLPEFSKAWLKVSETFPNFKHMCPIPLDY